jgi:SAM-dependent methyltransferase
VSVDGTLHSDRRRAGSFGEVAEQYDRVRPEYPVELVDTLVAGGPRTMLDVGCGTGISSRLFMARGCTVLGLEPDPRMAEVARRSGVEVESGAFEEWEAGGRRFDLVTAGQSWHWVDPLRGAAKAATVLRHGGRIGLFWNQSHPDPSVRPALDAAYARHAPELNRRSVLLGRRDPSLYESCARSLRASSAFEDVSVVVFGHDADYALDEWIDLSVTHSDHRMLPPDRLTGLLADLRREIERAGGRVPVHYEATLVTGVRH